MEKSGNRDKVILKGMATLFQVFDMHYTIHFYKDLLSFEIVSTSEPYTSPEDVDWAWLRYNDIDVMFNTAYEREHRPPLPDPKHQVAHGDTSLYFGCPNVEQLYNYFIANGLKLKEPIITKYQFKAIYVKDPDGYELCFHWPLDGRWD